MLSSEDKARLAVDREALKAYWEGRQDEAFVFERHDAYHVCEVLFPSTAGRLWWPVRAFLVGTVSLVPVSRLKASLFRLLGARIGRGVYIAPGVLIDPLFPRLVELEDGCFLGMGCKLFAHEYTAANFRIGRVRVGKGSVVGGYSVVRAGVSIGNNVTVGFNSYVNRDVPDGVTVGGVPARPLRRRPENG